MGAPPVSGPHSRSRGPGDPRPGRAVGAAPRACARGGHHARRAAGAVSGSERRAKRPARGRGESSRRRVPGQVGNRDPRAPREGKATPGITFAGRTSGRDAGLTPRRHAPPEQCPAGQGLSRAGVPPGVSREGPGGRAGSLSPDPEAPCSRPGPRHGAAVRRAPRRAPAGPARAAPRPSGGGAARRAGVNREGRCKDAAPRATLLRGQERPAGGGDEPGGARRAGFPCLLPWLQDGP